MRHTSAQILDITPEEEMNIRQLLYLVAAVSSAACLTHGAFAA